MAEPGRRPTWPDPPPGRRALPGARSWRALLGLRRRGVLTGRRLGCAALVLAVLAVAGLVLADRVADAVGSLLRDDPDPVAGGPFDPVAPSTAPGSGSSAIDLITRRDRLIVAVQQVPGLLERDAAGGYTGFDVALIELIARDLGVDPKRTAFKPLPAGAREAALLRGEVDLVIGGYQITDARQAEIDFAGPYLVSPQRLAVPPDSTVTGLDSLRDGRVCAVAGSPAALTLADRLGERLETRASLRQCTGLLDGHVAALAGDELLLAADPTLRLVGAPLGETRYGVGLAPGDPVLAGRIDSVLRRAVQDGTWARLYAEHLGPPVPDPPRIG